MVELLAPAGNWESLETVVRAGADAVYLGGKKHNMRLLRSGFNFSNDQLEEAVKFTHANNVKIYITVNNLQDNQELEEMEGYLKFLADIGPDALIVQDLGVIQLINKLGLDIPLHSSVMMNVHNKGMIDFLKTKGIERFIVSRELSFDQSKLIAQATGAELEYFVHGDMCFAQSGQCFLSGMLFGNSSNRGRCLKPCRWQYELARERGGSLETAAVKADGPYFLAVKDMCLHKFIPELIQSGIVSFKVEGRMKPPAQLEPIISTYRKAIDSYLEDPAGYKIDEENFERLHENRVRDFSFCFALENPGAAGIDYTGKREPKFFSEAQLEKEVSVNENILSELDKISERKENENFGDVRTKLAVKVVNLEQLKMAVEAGAERVYFGGEVPAAKNPVGRKLIREAAKIISSHKSEVELIAATPRITMPSELAEYVDLIQALDQKTVAGILAGNPGIIAEAKRVSDLPIMADFGVNAFNSWAMDLLKEKGVSGAAVQLESSLAQALKVNKRTELSLEIIGHGFLPFMISDHCLIAELLEGSTSERQCPAPCKEDSYYLINKKGAAYRVMADQYCRNHLYLSKELSLFPYLEQILKHQFSSFRIDAQLYEPEKVKEVVGIYRKALDLIAEADNPNQDKILSKYWTELQKLSTNDYTLAAYEDGVLESGS